MDILKKRKTYFRSIAVCWCPCYQLTVFTNFSILVLVSALYLTHCHATEKFLTDVKTGHERF